ncbi:MAG: phosphatase PAP2 family protein [Actinobacteria bacterium]|nr:phosphatase PAP2 family protein [Actinomycetota bacterium]
MAQLAAGARPTHRRLPRHRSRVHASRSLAVAVAALLVATLTALPETVSPAERSVFAAVNGLPDAIEWPLWALMQLGAVLIVVVVALLAVLGWRRLRPSVDLLAAGLLTWFLGRVMKSLLGRGRPASFFDDVNTRSAGPIGNEGPGFPSGHTAVAFALATVAYPYLSARWRAVTLALAAAVGFTRLYFGAHLPLDVLGGAALGVAVGACVHLVMDLLTHHH